MKFKDNIKWWGLYHNDILYSIIKKRTKPSIFNFKEYLHLILETNIKFMK